MGEPAEPMRVERVARVGDIPRAAWDACAAGQGPRLADGRPGNPFVCHDFLTALEDSGCVGGATGWHPCPIIATAPDGTIAGVAPAYAKLHSQGEYVFDHGWADAYERAGGRYYPKIQVSVPFTPVTGPRLMRRDAAPAATLGALSEGLIALRVGLKASSTHVTFLPEGEALALSARGYLLRTDRQYHFENRGYRDFADVLDSLTARRRKVMRRERRDALAAGIEVLHLTGSDLTEGVWDAFFTFYMDTASRKWGRPYLNRRFFSLLGERMADRVLLIMARRNGRFIAGALNMIGADALYGRNWGAVEEHPFLHFELCYYQAIDAALARGLARVEAGAQGEHKLSRGYEPRTTFSCHEIPHPGLRRAVAAFLEAEAAHLERLTLAMREEMPFRRGPCDSRGGTPAATDPAAT